MTSCRLVLTAVCVLCAAGSARAQGFISPFAGYNFGGDSADCASLQNCEDKRLNVGVSIGATHGVFGFEEDIAYAPEFFGKTPGGSNAVLTVMSNVSGHCSMGPTRVWLQLKARA